MPASEVQLHTPSQVADLLGVKPDTIRDWIRKGTLTAVDLRTGKRREPLYRIAESDLREFVAARRS